MLPPCVKAPCFYTNENSPEFGTEEVEDQLRLLVRFPVGLLLLLVLVCAGLWKPMPMAAIPAKMAQTSSFLVRRNCNLQLAKRAIRTEIRLEICTELCKLRCGLLWSETCRFLHQKFYLLYRFSEIFASTNERSEIFASIKTQMATK